MPKPPQKLDVNVVPDSYRRRLLERRQLLFLLALAILVALTVPLYNMASSAIDKTAEMNDEVDILNGQLESKIQDSARQTEMDNLVQDYETITQMQTVISDDIEAIENAAAYVGMEIRSIFHDSDEITVGCLRGERGYDDFLNALEAYRQELLQTENFSSVEIPTNIVNYPPPISVVITIIR